jgi:hypothetical protein
MDDSARSHYRRLAALSAASRGKSNDERRRGAGARPQTLACDPAPASETRSRGCQWPMWPGGRVPRPAPFCGAARVDGGSYCAAHRAIAFTTTSEDTDG